MSYLLVFLGGGLGSLLRYMIGISFQKVIPSLPLATLISNVLACLLFGLTLWLLQSKENLHTPLRLLLLVGFCGGLSTFSSFGYETFLLFKEQLFLAAALNIIVSVSLCLIIFYLFYLTPGK
ncbi:MAG: fluoride efflux transporter CrcB [bacterium]|nr:fluoride efflux transporter CrcB [bacterium]